MVQGATSDWREMVSFDNTLIIMVKEIKGHSVRGGYLVVVNLET